MNWEFCQGLQAKAVRQLLGEGGHGGVPSGDGAAELCTCIHPHALGTEVEHVMVQACLWVAFCISVIILIYYAWCTFKGHCGWEEVYVCTVEMLKTIMEVFYETYTPATIVQFNGIHISWLRYAEWLLTCPVILIHLSNLTGLGQYNKRTMRLLVSDIGTIVCGVTAALCPAPAKIVFFLMGCCYGASTFITAASVYISAYKEVPEGQCKMLVKACAWVFFGSWLLFPILFLMGPEGFGHLSPWGSIIAHTFADLLSKNLWGLLAHHLRNKVVEHIHKYGSTDVPPEEEGKAAGVAILAKGASAKLGKVDTPVTPRAASLMAQAAANGDATARIQLQRANSGIDCTHSFNSSPTKAYASLGRNASGTWIAAAAGNEPVRVLVGLPAEDAETVLEQFQEQFAALPIAAVALPATSPAALLLAAANAAAFGGADAALLHLSYLFPGAPDVPSAADYVATLRELGLRVHVYGCHVGGPSGDLSDMAELLDGWVEGPTWAAPLNNRQLTALLLVMHAARNASRPTSGQGISRAVSPGTLSLRANSMGPVLRSRSSGNFLEVCGPAPNHIRSMQSLGVSSGSNRASFDTTWRGLSCYKSMETAHQGVPVRPSAQAATGPSAASVAVAAAPVAASGGSVATSGVPSSPGPTQTGAPGVQNVTGMAIEDAEILQQLMTEITRLKAELSLSTAGTAPQPR